MLVSVPYRGATFLNTPSFFVITPLKARFPSPIGELHFSIIRTAVKFDCNVFMFPSPIGELHFSIFFRQIFWARKLCFRPLSGSYISQSPESAESTRLFPVSVPYRGATFLNIWCDIWCSCWCILFPSPIGELHFSINLGIPTHSIEMFPSPIGELHFSILLFLGSFNPVTQFPSPIGELHFSIKNS